MPDHQLLHLVIGGELKQVGEHEFRDLTKVDFVGAYPDFAGAAASAEERFDVGPYLIRRVSAFPLPGSAPMVSRPTRGVAMPSAICAYATPSWPNCTSISGFGSAVAPASMSTVGFG